MFTRFKQSSSVVFLDPQRALTDAEKKGKIALILSPSLYWVKRVKLPVKSVREARGLLESFFEDSLPEGKYSYSVYKEGEDFLLFAYEDKKILELIAQKGLNISNIKSIHFAQSEFSTLENPVSIHNDAVMSLKDGVVILTPASWAETSSPLELAEKKFSKHTIKLQQFGHIVDTKSLYRLGVILLLFIIVLAGELFITNAKTQSILASKDALFSKYNLQPTMFQNKSTQSKYKGIYSRGEKLRLYISYFLNMRLKPEQKITLISYKNRLLSITFSGVGKGNERNILKKLDAKKLQYKKSFHNESMKVEIKI